MKRMQRAALLTELADRMQNRGSWCGETHLQKSTYLLQELLKVPTDFQFILYKFGPYSFDLGDTLTELQADELLELTVRHRSYGQSYYPTESSVRLRSRYPVTLEKYSGQLDFVTVRVGAKGVAELERLATALYVTRKHPALDSARARAARLTEIKPHVPIELAIGAVEELDEMIEAAESSFPELAV